MAISLSQWFRAWGNELSIPRLRGALPSRQGPVRAGDLSLGDWGMLPKMRVQGGMYMALVWEAPLWGQAEVWPEVVPPSAAIPPSTCPESVGDAFSVPCRLLPVGMAELLLPLPWHYRRMPARGGL